jgi:ABC-type nitrate/sulfonate/bicarbonate transport system substrate-binding protein
MAARRSWARTHEAVMQGFVRAYDAGYAWLQDAVNARQALALLPARLDIAPTAAERALQEFAARARPQVTEQGLREVIDIVWEAEGHSRPKGDPGRYMDLSYAAQALAA